MNTHGRQGRRIILFSLVFLALAAVSALAVHDAGVFELDGNIVDDATPGGTDLPTDWADLFSSGTPGGTPLTLPSTGVTSVFFHDESDPDSTLFNGNKDTQNISSWSCISGTPSPDKNNLMHVYAAAFQPTSGAKSGHILIYMALERYANDGSADVGFWLLRDSSVSCSAPGSFTGVHQTGDLLVVASFTNGGAVSNVDVYEWNGSGLNTTPIASGASCTAASANDNVCGEVNTTSLTTPWADQDKTSAPNTLAVSEFFEVGIDATNLLQTGTCTTNFLAETRTSSALSANLSDYVLGSVNICGNITIVDDTVLDDPQDFSYTTTGGLSPSSFSLDDDSNPTLSNTKTYINVAPGTYTVTETLPVAGFDLTNLVCVEDRYSGTTTNLVTGTATISLDAGETVTCTYTNTKKGSITIIKDTVPDDPQDFSFSSTIPGCTSFSLDDDTNATLSNTQTCSDVPVGSYTVTESTVSGFTLTSLVCTDPDSGTTTNLGTATATIDLDAGEAITCTFTNTKQGTIEIIKDTVPDDPQDFSFSSNITGCTSFSLDDDADGTLSNTKICANVPIGSYTLAENATTGFALTSLVCSDPDNGTTINLGTSTATIDLDPGETVTCTFTNTKSGTIIVEKQTNPDGDSQSFIFTGTTSGSISDGQQITVNSLAPGTYTSTEAVPSGWDLTSIVCDDANSSGNVATKTATFQVEAGETVKCIFTDTKRGTITIIKDTVPNDPQDFAFTTTGGLSPSTFSLDDDSNATLSNAKTYSNVVSGTYTVSETAVAGFDLTTLVCSDPDNGTTINLGTSTTTIDLDPGETVTCTFTNTKRGTIIVEKQTLPDGDSQSFTFTGTASGSISDGQQITVANLVPGTYTSTETVPSGWDLTSIVCNDSNSSGNVASKTATFQLDPGETVKCTFTDTKRGTLIVEKQTSPDGNPQSFTFTGDVAGAISDNGQIVVTKAPGTYTSTETAQAGWELISIVCDDANSSGNMGTRTATFQLEAGETVKCTFTNSQWGTIIVEKQTLPDGDPQSFTFTGTASGSISDGQQITVTNLMPGTYTSTETVPSGWDLTSIVCNDSNSSGNVSTKTATFQLDAGETVKCVFTDTKRGTIIVEKQTLPDGDPQQFTFNGDANGNISDGQQIIVNNLVPGTYTSTETVPSGWDLTSIVCNDSNSSGDLVNQKATYQLDPGETIKCVFTNTKRGTITVEVQTQPGGDSQSFPFNGAINGSISDGQQIMVMDLKPGTYSTTVTLPVVGTGLSWDLTSVVCDDTNSTGDLDAKTVTFQLDPGETVTCTLTITRRGSLEGDAFKDMDRDGQARESGDPILPSWTVQLYDTSNNLVASTVTDSNGHYEFNNIVPGAYKICEVNPDPMMWTQSFPGTVMSPPCPANASKGYVITLAPGATLIDLDLGNFCTGVIRGVVYLDYDADGNRDPNDPYLEGVTLTLTGTDENGNPVSLTTATDAEGKYWFISLLPGTYTVCLTLPPGMHETFPRNGTLCSNGTHGHTIVLVDCENTFAKFAITPDSLGEAEGLSVLAVQALSTKKTIYFHVAGLGIQDLRVQVFDLKGRIVYTSDWQPNGWAWDLQDKKGLPVARGVYLYTISVRGHNGRLAKTKLQKLIITYTKPQELAVTSVQALEIEGKVHFLVAGRGAMKDLRVQVFDLKGRTVYTSGWQPSGWTWALRDTGQRVVRGVYLVLVIVRGQNGEVVKTQVQKLIIK